MEATVVEPDELQAEVARLDPALVIGSQPKPATSDSGPSWMEIHPYDEASASVCIGGRCARFMVIVVTAFIHLFLLMSVAPLLSTD